MVSIVNHFTMELTYLDFLKRHTCNCAPWCTIPNKVVHNAPHGVQKIISVP